MSIIDTLKFIVRHPLNRGREIESLVRFANWQIGSRLMPDAMVHNWINGSKFMVRRGETGLTGNIYTGLHEFPDMGFLLHVLREEDLFVDVGANVGSYTILACAVVGARGVAFEPIPDTYRRLVENMRLNHLDEKVACINKGVGLAEGRLAFSNGGSTTNHALAVNEKCLNTVDVEITTLDASLNRLLPTLMKIDVEGYETPALEGAQATLSNRALHSVIMELNGSGMRYGYNESQIVKMMFDHGFRTYTYEPMTRKLTDLEGVSLRSGNTLFVRDRFLVEEKLSSSPQVVVNGIYF